MLFFVCLYDARSRYVVSRLIVIDIVCRKRLPKRRQEPGARLLRVRDANFWEDARITQSLGHWLVRALDALIVVRVGKRMRQVTAFVSVD